MTHFMAEFLGTMLLVLLGDGVVANVLLNDTKGNNSGWIVITTGWALGVLVGVTIGLAIAGKFAWAEVGTFPFAQLLGAMTGAFLVSAMYYRHFQRTNNPG